jgi:hypothetical protein
MALKYVLSVSVTNVYLKEHLSFCEWEVWRTNHQVKSVFARLLDVIPAEIQAAH